MKDRPVDTSGMQLVVCPKEILKDTSNISDGQEETSESVIESSLR